MTVTTDEEPLGSRQLLEALLEHLRAIDAAWQTGKSVRPLMKRGADLSAAIERTLCNAKIRQLDPSEISLTEPEDSLAVCWYCGHPYESEGHLRRTEEHLWPRVAGAREAEREGNRVWAHGICNELAGDFFPREKEILRAILMLGGPPLSKERRRQALRTVLARVNPATASPKAKGLLGSIKYNPLLGV